MRKRRTLIAESGPSQENIWDLGLVETSVTAGVIMEKANTYFEPTAAVKRFQGAVLGYVTPWNHKGAEYAVRFRAKLTHVSPVWYQLRRVNKKGQGKVWSLEGGHEFNKTWVDALREPAGEAGSVTRVVPRVIVEVDTPQDHLDLVREPEEAIRLIVAEMELRKYDGLVLEVWMAWWSINGLSNKDFTDAACSMVKQLSQALQGMQPPRQLIMAVPPPIPSGYSRPSIDKAHLRRLSPFVSHWSLMTYDHSIGHGPQANAPMPWLLRQTQLLLDGDDGPACVNGSQAMMGLAFYGYDYKLNEQASPEAVVADTLLSILGKQQPALLWDKEQQEHHFDYKGMDGEHRVFCPTPRSLEVRLELFQKLGLSVSIWELGQGMQRLFDLL
eukprot:CAMPEP_0119104084 /NCGR_PEP_ID=MMETSP1180-20130426/2392_1 /TAXON_ID=3052 ORGANISM="Chlamydomonas cf sp, Strain CCMP681" /NCGR_SAMPLE_ID=MMETSP1180 /ASSEMBLY_ACC=CAM_ASM_000741 /LENGTH=384 /DNA_ID=CAMNT_0007088753 /DNA_START=158 /DNA_END=1312 /DNA_ORIENTATION=-